MAFIQIEKVECRQCYAHFEPGVFARKRARAAIDKGANGVNLECQCPLCGKISFHDMRVTRVSDKFFVIRNAIKEGKRA